MRIIPSSGSDRDITIHRCQEIADLLDERIDLSFNEEHVVIQPSRKRRMVVRKIFMDRMDAAIVALINAAYPGVTPKRVLDILHLEK